MTRPTLRSLIPLMLVLTILAGGAMAQNAHETVRAEQDRAEEETLSESEREDVLLRKMILLGFPAAAVAGLVIALIVTRKKGRERRRQAQQDRD